MNFTTSINRLNSSSTAKDDDIGTDNPEDGDEEIVPTLSTSEQLDKLVSNLDSLIEQFTLIGLQQVGSGSYEEVLKNAKDLNKDFDQLLKHNEKREWILPIEEGKKNCIMLINKISQQKSLSLNIDPLSLHLVLTEFEDRQNKLTEVRNESTNELINSADLLNKYAAAAQELQINLQALKMLCATHYAYYFKAINFNAEEYLQNILTKNTINIKHFEQISIQQAQGKFQRFFANSTNEIAGWNNHHHFDKPYKR